jgi:hypothetical protein
MNPENQEVNWRQFPAIQRVFESGRLEEFMAGCANTCRQLDELAQSGSPEMAARARSAMNAYGHTLRLLQDLAGRIAAE